MKVAIMQPYFFPYIGYFSLINHTDKFIFFDTPQYIRHGWINRNRILSSNGESVYFTVPIEKCERETPINKIVIANNTNWREKIMGQLSVYKKKATNYESVIDLVKETIYYPTEKIADLAILSITKSCEWMELNMDAEIFSEMNLKIGQVNSPDEWALEISKAIGAEGYINPPGGQSFFDRGKYKQSAIELQFLQQEIVPYIQKIGRFEPALSIIDVMMFCSPREIKDMFGQCVML